MFLFSKAPDIIRGIKFTASSHTELVVAIPVKQDISVARGVITRFYCSIISYTGDNPLQEESFPTNDNGIYCVDVEYLSDIDREDLQNITFKELGKFSYPTILYSECFVVI